MTTPAGDDVAASGRLIITLDAGEAEAEAERLGERIERILDRATRDAGRSMQRNITRAIRAIDPQRVRVTADLQAFQRSLNDLNNLGSSPIRVTPDVDRARFEAAIQAALDGLEVSVRVEPNLDGFDAAIRAHNTPTVRVDVEADVDRDRFGRAMANLARIATRTGGALASSLAFGAVGIAAAGAATSITALGAALAPAAGAVAALPAAAAGATIALGTLKLATAGVGDAFKALASGDTKALQKAMENLSPAAQEAVRSLQGLTPQLKAIQQGVQDSFFQQFGTSIKTAVTNLLPLKTGLQGIAAQFGQAANEGLKFAASKDALTGLRAVIDGTTGALSGIPTATQPILKGFLDIAAAVSEAFGSNLGNAIGQAGAQFGTFLSGLAASGRAVELVKAAGEVFHQLGDIASNVGDILSNVFGAANAVGAGLLNNLARLTQGFADFTASAQGQEAIGNIFSTLATVAAQLGPILQALVSTVGQLAPALAPLFTAIGPAITGVIQALGPALAGILPGVQALVNGLGAGLSALSSSGALTSVGQAFGSLLASLAPLLPLVGQLAAALGPPIAAALGNIAAALTPVIAALSGALAPVLPVLSNAITTLVAAMTPFATLLGQTLGSVITAVAPLLATLATVFTQVATAIAPLTEQITTALIPIFATLTPAITAIVNAIIPLVQQLIAALLPVLPPITEAFTAILGALTPLIPIVAQLVTAIAPLVALLITALAPVIQFAAEIIKWTAINVVVPIIEGIISVISSIVGTVTTVISAVSGFVTSVIGFFSNLRSTVPALISSMINAAVGFFASLPGRALSALSSLVGFLSGVINSAKSAVTSRITALVTEAVSRIRELPGKAKAALGNLASTLVGVGQDLVRGLINGIKAMAGSLVSAAKSVVQGAIDGAKSLLGINSPSKVFAQIGKDTGQGLINGLTGSVTGIKTTADKMVKAITDAFKGRRTRVDDTLVKQLRKAQGELTKLANQRDAIAKRIKEATDFAASTSKSALDAFSLSSITQDRGGSISNLQGGLNDAISQIRRFNTQVNTLAKRGLRKDLLRQIIGLGPEQGAALANTLSRASSAQLEDLNEAQKQLDAASKKLGKDSADALFDAGKQASKGFLTGLAAQRKDVEKLMVSIATSIQKAIKKALGIKSPSRVMALIGKQTMQGLRLGVDDQVPAVGRSALRAANALTDPFGDSVATPRLHGRSGLLDGVSARSRGAVTNSTSTTTNRTVAPVFNISSPVNGEALAQQIINRMALSGVWP